ncbi:MAG TPA: hypothetical protein VHY58_21980 [Streptosporangiaceae bacterium]|nr:hypothetical protein [Streptosporangiaceae bacterium]
MPGDATAAGRAAVSQAAGESAPTPASRPGQRAPRLRPWAEPALWVLGVLAVFAVNLQIARTRAVNSDGAGNALQAWAMLHGNLLLHGWHLSDVPFYTTELPEYMLVELVRGLNADVVHVAAAVTYTLAMLLAALLAKGHATGREGVARVLITAGIMLAPQLDSGVNVLISSPDHIGTLVPVMAVWLLLDHARPRWYIPAIAAVVLGWAQVADTLVLYIGVLPLALVCVVRVYRAVAVQRKPLASQWYYVALGVGALAGAAAAMLALHVIYADGGFYSPHATAQLAAAGAILPGHLRIAAEGLLILGGADFLGLQLHASAAFILLHVVGVALLACGIWAAARHFLADRDLVAQLLVAGVAINLITYVISTQAVSSTSTREIAAVLPLSAALAGRLLAGRLTAGRQVPLLAIVAVGYLAGMVYEVSRPTAPAQNQRLEAWLAARHLHTGLSGYWESGVVTLASGNRVQIRQVVATPGGRLLPSNVESDWAWYDPARNSANFVVLSRGVPGYPGFTSKRAVLATFGPPAQTYHFGIYTVLIWHKNLLSELPPPRLGTRYSQAPK